MIPQYEPLVTDTLMEVVAGQIKSGWIGPGKAVQKFERLLCEKTGAKHAIATTSGTTAIMMALHCMFPAESKLVFPAYGYVAGINAAIFLGHDITLVDVNDSVCMDAYELSKALEKSMLDGVLYIDHNGDTKNIKEIQKACDTHRENLAISGEYLYLPEPIEILEDSAVALGCPNAGRVGECGIFSFSVPKLLTTGQGGAVITDNSDLAEQLRNFSDQGGNWRKDRVHRKFGLNFRMSDITASYGIPQLENLEQLVEIRNKIWDFYFKYLPSEYLTYIGNDTCVSYGGTSGWCITIEHTNAPWLIKYLQLNDIQSSQFYHPVYKNLPYCDLGSDKEFPVAAQKAKDLVYLPSSLSLTEDNVRYICEKIEEFDQKNPDDTV